MLKINYEYKEVRKTWESVLSQSEIDDLLKALSSGELDVDEMKNGEEKQVKNYDFARPSKFSKEHLRTLEIIFRAFWKTSGNQSSSLFKKSSQC